MHFKYLNTKLLSLEDRNFVFDLTPCLMDLQYVKSI